MGVVGHPSLAMGWLPKGWLPRFEEKLMGNFPIIAGDPDPGLGTVSEASYGAQEMSC
jgi:hypothetical protein